jgi:hypothetical protein
VSGHHRSQKRKYRSDGQLGYRTAARRASSRLVQLLTPVVEQVLLHCSPFNQGMKRAYWQNISQFHSVPLA